MSIIPVPKANAMLICDYVITERGTNKKSLIGVFENIGAVQFPCTHYQLSVYIKLTDAQGKYRFRLELTDLQNDATIGKSEMPEPIQIANPLITHELVFNLRGLRFPHAGEYEFRIFANDHIFGQKSFIVNEIKPNGQPNAHPESQH
ncbi:MAG TPA: hypothetical protein PLY88_04700 [Candidatus Omnitrophota bacterium]|nr:hypothetical protein [Candidatus Omnitrophota bacterium]HRK61833.1 hypothetical protein [Candidatus Omnitrophota bacterium]